MLIQINVIINIEARASLYLLLGLPVLSCSKRPNF